MMSLLLGLYTCLAFFSLVSKCSERVWFWTTWGSMIQPVKFLEMTWWTARCFVLKQPWVGTKPAQPIGVLFILIPCFSWEDSRKITSCFKIKSKCSTSFQQISPSLPCWEVSPTASTLRLFTYELPPSSNRVRLRHFTKKQWFQRLGNTVDGSEILKIDENRVSQKESNFPTIIFQGLC